jgi:hypothetical protein
MLDPGDACDDNATFHLTGEYKIEDETQDGLNLCTAHYFKFVDTAPMEIFEILLESSHKKLSGDWIYTMKVKVSELVAGDVILRPGQMQIPLYEIVETWPLTDNEYAATVKYINSFLTTEKFWKSPDVEVLVDRPE